VQININVNKQIEAFTSSLYVSEGTREAKAALKYTFGKLL
jgi:hypothetical protein